MSGGTIRAFSSMDNLSDKDRKVFEELSKQIDKLKTDLEAEKQKLRQLHRDKVLELKAKQEEFDRKLERSLEAQAKKREFDKQADLKSLEDKLKKQKEKEIKNIWRLKEDEIKRLKKQLAREKEDAIKDAVDCERKKTVEKVHEGEDILANKVTQLTKDIFALNEHNSRLEEQVKLLTQENHDKIELMRRMKKEHESKLEVLVKQYKSDAMRESAKLKLAERRIHEKDQHLSLVEHKADMANIEREAISDELSRIKKSIRDTPPGPYRPATPDLTNDRITPPSPTVYNPLQNRINDLQAHCKKIEEQVLNLKQDNAQLRKKLSKDGGDGSDINTNKEVEEKMKKLRKRNAELVSLAKQLDERCKALKAENEQLQSANVSEDDKGSQQALRRQFSRQQAKELTEHTKQLHTKDVELEALRQQVSKLQAEAKTSAQPSEKSGTGLCSDNIAIVMKENLRMEKLLVACYQKSQEAKEVPLDPLEGFHAAENHMRQLQEQNTALHAQVKELSEAAAATAGATSNIKVEHSSEELTKLQKAKEESNRLASQLEKELVVVRHDNSSLKNKLASQQSITVELQEKCEQLKQSLAAETADCSKHKVLVEQLREECSRLQKNEENDSINQPVSAEDLECFTREAEQLKEENKRLLTASSDLSTQLSTVKKQYAEMQTAVIDKERLANKLTDELKRARSDKQSVAEELERTKAALAAATEERDNMLKKEQRQALLQQKESETHKEAHEALLQQQKAIVTSKDKTSALKHSDEAKGAIKEPHKGDDEDLLDNQKQTENQKTEKVVTNEDQKLSQQEAGLASNRPPITPRASASVPIGKKSTQKQLITKYGSPPKHISPKSIANLQSEFQQAGYEIEDGFDSEGDLNTFSELKREEAECVSTTSLEDSLLGSESFVSLDNYSQKHKQEKPSRVSSAKEKERKHSQESDKERKHSQESDKEYKCPQEFDSQPKKKSFIVAAVAAAMSPSAATTASSIPSEQSLQEPSVNLAEEVSQASEATQPISTKSSTISDAVNLSSKDQTPNKVSFWSKDATVENDEDSSDSDSSDDDDIVINKVAVSSQAASSTMSQDVALFVVKFDYDPARMSPNPNPQQELTLTAGRYVYIYGEMDEDGFYKGQTVDGQQAGLVPSNFIERVNEAELVKRRQKMSSPRRGMLQHIDEEEENDPNSDKSITATVAQLLPPENVHLVERSINPVSQSVKMTIGWEPVEQASTDTVGYSVYINGELYSIVAGVDTKLAELTGLLPNKSLTVTVRTCGNNERESHDQPHPLAIGRDMLSAPQKVSVTPSPTSPSLSVTWTHPPKTSLNIPPTHFAVLIDNVECCRVEASQEKALMTIEISLDDITECGVELSMEHQIAVRSIAGEHHSLDSDSVTITSNLASHLKNFTTNSSTASDAAVASRIDTSVSSSVNNSLINNRPVAKPHGMFTSSPMDYESSSSDEDSSEDDVEIVSPSNRSIREDSLSPITGGLTNGTVTGSVKAKAEATAQDQVDGMNSTARYYRAVYSYNPMMMSPNEGLEEEELCFNEGDIIKAVGDVDSDGFMEGEMAGKKGLVPSNMIEEITDMDKLQSLMVDHLNSSSASNHVQLLNGCLSRLVKARYNYNPGVDSPNECNADEELCFQSGDVITVCGEVDDDGFFLGELNGKRGMVPSNFVEVVADDKMDGEDVEVFSASQEDMQRASQIIKEKVGQKVDGQSRKPAPRKPPPEKKRSILKGKGLINRTKKK